MTASAALPAFGWGLYGAFSVESGQTIRMGLTWAGDPGPVYLSVSAGIIPSTLTRGQSTRELSAQTGYSYATTEWITVTATSSLGWIDDIGLSYFATHDGADFIDLEHEIVVPQLRYHAIEADGRVVAWVKAEPAGPSAPPSAGRPIPVIGAAQSDHTLHLDLQLDLDLDSEGGGAAMAERLCRVLPGR